jgi:hypothetical protein
VSDESGFSNPTFSQRHGLEDGTHLTATEGHPFKTPEGWRDAIVLKKGGKLLLPGEAQGVVEITQIAHRIETLTTYNLEVANAHTFFVGNDGVLVHNGRGGVKPGRCWRKEYERREGKPWPITDCGQNYHAHHKHPLADGGEDIYENIEPMHPRDHREHHSEDRRRWGGRGKK